jgi:hypothetical protein
MLAHHPKYVEVAKILDQIWINSIIGERFWKNWKESENLAMTIIFRK